MITEINDKTLGYIAGMIDGEGSVFLWKDTSANAKKHNKRGFYYHPVITVTNCDLNVLEYLQNIIGGRICIKKPKGNRKVGYTLLLDTNYIRKLIPLIEDIIIIKYRQLQLMEEYLSTTITHYCKYNPPPKDILKKRDEIYFELKQLNKRGRIK